MVTEKMIEAFVKASSVASGDTADCVRAGLEAALSTDAEPVGDPLELPYKNWRGETSTRKIQPIRLEFGATEWHPEPQWLLVAIDIEKNAERSFALKDFNPPQPAPSVAVKALDWERRESISRYSGMTGYYSILLLDDGQWKFTYGSPGKTATFDVSKHPNRDEAENAAQDVHNTMIRDALSAQVQDVVIPNGWQLVPKEPTPEMIKAYRRVGSNQKIREGYAAALAAAPAAKQGEAE